MINLLRQRKPYFQSKMKFICFIKQILPYFFFLLPVFSQAQNFQVTEANADCVTPIFLTDTIYGPTNAPTGFGNVNEFQDVLGNLYSFEKEHHSVWFKFISPATGTQTFDIIPECIKDDYDFLLFKYTGNESGFCENIKSKKLKPIRSAISRNDKTILSMTGLKSGTGSEFIHSGPGESYSKPLEINKNDVYYLVLDNVYEYGCGFTLKLHYKFSVPGNSMNITLLDSLSVEMINGNIDIICSLKNDTLKKEIHQKNISNYFMPVDSLHTYLITASSKGYFTKSLLYMPSTDTGVVNLKINLQKIEIGKKIVLENIYFYGNSDVFLPKSNQALDGLLGTMKDNSNLNIEVQGHVNWPFNSLMTPADTSWCRKLSIMRAKAVCKYLTDNSIAEDRLSFKGFGNSHMLFPYAKTAEEMEKNRRVEILVISNEE